MSMRQLKITKSITNRESQSLEKYLQEIGRVELITPEEEVRLSGSHQTRRSKALERLTKANLRFVVSVAKQYQNQGLSLPDLINEGNLGLIKAAQRFDETKGFKFISYAVWWIRQSILQALAEQARIVRLPLNKVGLPTVFKKPSSNWNRSLNESLLRKNWQNCSIWSWMRSTLHLASMYGTSAWIHPYLKAKKAPCWMYWKIQC
jgi:RNA polymerase primary sigma factor